MSTATDILNALLDPKIHQVIGSTPDALKTAITDTDIKGKVELGYKFVALCIFAASVNKQTTEQFFMESSMADLRVVISRKFVLNSRPNMTALSLAGHCFLTIDNFSDAHYVKEFRKKMGQNSIWDGTLASGSLSEKQKQIFQERSKSHEKKAAVDFANFFVMYTGAGSSTAPPVTVTGSSKGFPLNAPSGKKTDSDDDVEFQNPAPPDVKIPDDIKDFYLNEQKGNQSTWNSAVQKHGIDKVTRSVRKRMSGDDSTTVVGGQ